MGMMKMARPHYMRQNSQSFARLHDTLKPLGCWWLDQELNIV